MLPLSQLTRHGPAVGSASQQITNLQKLQTVILVNLLQTRNAPPGPLSNDKHECGHFAEIATGGPAVPLRKTLDQDWAATKSKSNSKKIAHCILGLLADSAIDAFC